MIDSMTFLVTALLVLFTSVNAWCQKKGGVERTGDILQVAVPFTAALSTVVYKDNSNATWQFAKAFGSSMLITHGLKRTINKQRPSGGNYSFPSGHTTAAFSGAAFIHYRYGFKPSIVFYGFSAYVAWSRVYAAKHDWVDVSAGAVIGIASSYLFTRKYEFEWGSASVGTNGMGLTLTLHFD